MDLLYDYKDYSAHAFPPSPAVSGAKQISRSIFFSPPNVEENTIWI